MNIIKRIAGTIVLPVGMFILMLIFCRANGKDYYGTWKMWQTLIPNIGVSVTCALGIGLQYRAGRFDFSGGAIMLLTSIIAGNLARDIGNSVVLLWVLCLGVSVVLSLIVATLYVYGKVPIVIITIGMALFLEALSCLVFKGSGVSLVSNLKLSVFCRYPYVIIPFVLAVIIYAFYYAKTTPGRQSELLANNQKSAVHIGISEKKNVFITYIVSGLIFGLATLLSIGTGIKGASYTALSTAGELFSNILPVFIGLMLAKFCGQTIGLLMGSITLCLLSYGLSAVFSFEMGSAITTICTGMFILLLNVFYVHGINMIKGFTGLFRKKVV